MGAVMNNNRRWRHDLLADLNCAERELWSIHRALLERAVTDPSSEQLTKQMLPVLSMLFVRQADPYLVWGNQCS